MRKLCILILTQDFSFYDDSEGYNVAESHNFGLMSPFYPQNNKTEMKFENNPFLQQINQEFNNENDEKMQEECFGYQGFFDSEPKPPHNMFFDNPPNSEPKKKTKGSFKNTYINKINHLMKNNKNKQNTNDENAPTKYIFSIFSPEILTKERFNRLKTKIPRKKQ